MLLLLFEIDGELNSRHVLLLSSNKLVGLELIRCSESNFEIDIIVDIIIVIIVVIIVIIIITFRTEIDSGIILWEFLFLV